MIELTKRAWGEPLFAAQLRTVPEDFVVDECLDLPPDTSGVRAHLWLHVQKRERNTQDVASLLATLVGAAARDIGFAGLKDRRAVTRQWFSLPAEALAGDDGVDSDASPDAVVTWMQTRLSEEQGVEVLGAEWRARKLRRGAHAGNRFAIVLRDVRPVDGAAGERVGDDLDARLAERVTVLRREGFPNAFGPQRFGAGGRNLSSARRLLSGARALRRPKGQRQRQERGLLLSAARSAIFNSVLDARIAAGNWLSPLNGEPLMLAGSNSRFVPDVIDDEIRARIASGDLSTTGPMAGRGSSEALRDCAALEATMLETESDLVSGLAAAGVDADRRALRARADDLECERTDAQTVLLRVSLAPGVFATSLLRELCTY